MDLFKHYAFSRSHIYMFVIEFVILLNKYSLN